jgi:hypothetical protein
MRPRVRDRITLLEMMPKGGVCAEIGVWTGGFSKRILRINKPTRLHLVDPWVFMPELPDRWYGGMKAASQQDMDAIHDKVVADLGDDERVVIHRSTSIEAAAELAGTTFDWVYVDGDHAEEAVAGDLDAWWPLIRSGGWLAGDDLDWADVDGSVPIRSALERFRERHGLGEPTTFGNQFALPKP